MTDEPMKDGLYTFRAEGCGHHLGNTLAHASGHARQEMLRLARIKQTLQDIKLSRILLYICSCHEVYQLQVLAKMHL